MKRVLIVLAVLLLLPYARTVVYDFPDPAPFTGASLYNPYAALNGVWQRANLHAHGRPWGGITNGRQTSAEIARAYLRLGYDLAGVSDYQHISAWDGVPTIPLYEHGYSLGKRHQLAIGTRGIEWFDFPLWQSISQQQLVIDLVRAKSPLVAIAHPDGRDAYSSADMRKLTGYQLLEVVNGPFVAERPWDAALSAGRAVWALADDDNHDVNNSARFGVAWNMIGAASASTAEIVAALRAGRNYAVLRTEGETLGKADITLESVDVREGTVRVVCRGAAATFLFVGQDGQVRRTIDGVTHAEYAFAARDTYIRTVVQTSNATLFLNPVFRYDGRRIPAPVARVDRAATWMLRGGGAAAGLVLVVFVVFLGRLSAGRRRQAMRAPDVIPTTPRIP